MLKQRQTSTESIQTQAAGDAARPMLRAVVLSLGLASARALAVATGHSRVFWLPWSALVFLLSFFSPLSGVALTLGNVMVSLDDASPLGWSVGQLAGAGAAARMILQLVIRKVNLSGVWRRSLAALATIAVVMILGSFRSPDLDSLGSALRKLSLIFLLYLLAQAYVRRPADLLFLLATLALCAAFAAAWAIGESFTAMAPLRTVGLVGNSNYLAIYSAVALPMDVGLAIYLKDRRWRALVIIAGISLVGGIVTTASRGGLLTLGISLVVVAILWGGRSRRARWLLGILLTVLVISLVRDNYAWTRVSGIFAAFGTGTAQDNSRLQLADVSLAVWRHYPLFGAGVGNWLYGVAQVGGWAYANSPHVWPAQILAEMGLLGFAAYVAFVIFCVGDYRVVLRDLHLLSSPHSDLVRAFLASALVMSLAWSSGNPLNQIWFMLLLFSGVCRRTFDTVQRPIERRMLSRVSVLTDPTDS